MAKLLHCEAVMASVPTGRRRRSFAAHSLCKASSLLCRCDRCADGAYRRRPFAVGHLHENDFSAATPQCQSTIFGIPIFPWDWSYPHAPRTASHWIKVVSDVRGSTHGNDTPVSESLQLILSNLMIKRLPETPVSLYPKVMHA